MAANSDHVPNGFGLGHTGQLCHELELAGVELLASFGSNGTLVGGVTLMTNVGATLAADGAAAQFGQQVFDVLASGLRLSVSLRELGHGSNAQVAFSTLCSLLRKAVDDAAASPERVELVVDAESLVPRAAWRIRRKQLGDGPVHLLPSQSAMQAGRLVHERRQNEIFWSQLRQGCTRGNVRAAFAPAVYSQCSLLSAEIATGVLPATAIQVPPGTAWLPMRVDVSRFADDGGSLCEGTIEHVLCRCVEIGDELHDSVCWPTARMRHDAWLNRRLAIISDRFR